MAATPLDLLGRWRLERTIEDRYAGARLRVRGEALLEPAGDGRVRWHEHGLLERPGAEPAAVHRTLFLVPDHPGDPAATTAWSVTFDDGRPFHPWTPGHEVDHPCAADHYRGLVETGDVPADGPTTWRVVWHVHGPAKDHTITTDYRAQEPA